MPLNPVNIGTAPDNGTGDALRTAFQKLNVNDTYLKTYAENLIQGLKWKNAVAVATTANITLSGEQTIDGVTTSASRVLVKDQTDATENGIYVSASGAWTRATDADADAELVNATVSVSSGTVNGVTNWTCNVDSVTLGTTELTFVPFVGADGVDQGTFDAAIASINSQISDNDTELADHETRITTLESEVVTSVTINSTTYDPDVNGNVNLGTISGSGASVDQRETASVATTKTMDWAAYDVFEYTMTADTTFSDSNLPTGPNAKTITLYLTGNFIPTFPAYWVVDSNGSDAYDGTVRNRIVVDCIEGTASSEDVTYNIKNL